MRRRMRDAGWFLGGFLGALGVLALGLTFTLGLQYFAAFVTTR